MRLPKSMTVSLCAIGFSLVGCADVPPPDSVAPVVGVKPPVAHPAEAEMPALPRQVRFSYVEFLVPADRFAELAAGTPDFSALLAEAKVGKVGVVPLYARLNDATTATIKSAVLMRYPNEHQVGGEMESAHPAAVGVTPANPVSVPAKTEAQAKAQGGVIIVPMNFVEKEVGRILEMTASVSADMKTVDLDLKPKHGVVEAESGATRDVFGFPCPPRFSQCEMQIRTTVKAGVATHLATYPAADGAKDTRARVVFVRADVE